MSKEEKKEYVKPEIQKHKAVAVVSGSDCGCSIYSASSCGNTYYH